MARKISCGSGWTLLSTECWLRESCKNCVYSSYCYRTIRKKNGLPMIKMVIDELITKFGEPPEKFIVALKEDNLEDSIF